jgi:hypothetical protein
LTSKVLVEGDFLARQRNERRMVGRSFRSFDVSHMDFLGSTIPARDLDPDHDVLTAHTFRSTAPRAVAQGLPKHEAAFPIQIGFRVGDRRFRIFDVGR